MPPDMRPPAQDENAIELRALLEEARRTLAQAGIENAPREARSLLAAALEISRESLLRLSPGTPLPSDRLRTLLARRAGQRTPMAHILGHQSFWTLTLAVSPATLIPRADTESLIEAALAHRPDRASVARILDLGTGTGALLLAALAEYPAAWGLGLDRSPAACALARANALANHLSDRATFAAADWTTPLDPAAAPFDLILSNPPYIPREDIPTLMPEVARHEPPLALDGGPDGLDAYRTLLPALPPLLKHPEGLAILELGAGQAPPVTALARHHGLTVAAIRPDLAGTPRALVLRPAP